MSDLYTLATTINTKHAEGHEYASKALGCAFVVGAALHKAKEECEHGDFVSWCENNLDFSYETVKVYMKVAENQSLIEKGSTATSLDEPLSLRGALRLIRKKPETEETPTEKEERLRKARDFKKAFGQTKKPDSSRVDFENKLGEHLMPYVKKLGEYPDPEAYQTLLKTLLNTVDDFIAAQNYQEVAA